ncbi:MAG: ArnT family glycosyltransferase [Gemmatimonadales bacterium]
MSEPPRTTGPSFLELGVITAIALAVRLPHLDSATPTYDEFYHLLAARGWLQDGSFHIGAGHYDRAVLFTRMVAESLRLFGDTLAAGRVPALLAGTLWVVGVFWWTRRVAGGLAGWAAALLLALDPGAVYLSQWVRFYTLHGLLVWVGAVCIYELITRRAESRRSMGVAALGAVAWGIAFALQRSTLVALGAVGLWAAVVLLGRRGNVLTRAQPRVRLLVIAGGVALCAAAAWLVTSGEAAAIWRIYSNAPTWAEDSGLGRRWYASWLAGRYSTLCALFPVAVLLAVARFTRPALFALTVFGTGFVAVSLGAPKQERYLYFVLPFFFAIWGFAVAALVPALRATAERAVAAVGGSRLHGRSRAGAAWTLTVLAVAVVLLANDAPRRTWQMVFPGHRARPYRLSDWTKALPQLRPLADSADVVIASYILKPIYYLGRGDVALSGAELAELEWQNPHPAEFSVDDRTGRPVISSPASLQRLMACFRSGLILVERFHLNRPILVPAAASAFIAANTEEVPLPPESWVHAFRWRHPVPPDQPSCPPWRSSLMTRPAS